jgi:hypothetical protein
LISTFGRKILSICEEENLIERRKVLHAEREQSFKKFDIILKFKQSLIKISKE